MDPKTGSVEKALPTSSQENRPELDVPLDIWGWIFKFLTKDKDLMRVNLSYMTWSEFLHRRKIKFMFPGVLPLLMDYIDGKDMLEMRLVCSKWKKSVDYLLEHGPLYRSDAAAASEAKKLLPLLNVSPQHAIFEQTMVTFTTAQQIVNFMTSMGINDDDGASSKNPFPGRSVRFSPKTNRVHILDMVKYEIQMRRLVKITGIQILRFQYKIPVFEYETAETGRNMLIRLLQNMPNLRALHLEDGTHLLSSRIIEGFQLIGNLEEGPVLDLEVVEEWLRIAGEGMDEPAPFPALPNLEEIICPESSLFHRECLETILGEYQNRIKRVRLLVGISDCRAFKNAIDQAMRESMEMVARQLVLPALRWASKYQI